MGWFLTDLVSAFLLPPLCLIVLGAVGVLLFKSRPVLGKFLVVVTFTLLYMLSIPFVADTALQTLETSTTSSLAIIEVQAIVVLGSGTYVKAPEYDGHTVSRFGLERIRYGAYLHRSTGKPLLVTGGNLLGIGSSEAEQMKSVLENEFHVPVKWVENNSNNTRENAYKSFAVLEKDKIVRVALVTHAWHMPRAIREFEQAGFKVTPAPTAYTTRYKTNLFAFIPSASALLKSSLFLHEIIGMLWYGLTPAPNQP